MPDGLFEAREMPLQSRLMPMTSVDEKARTAIVIWTTGASVRRYDWKFDRYYNEVLSLDPKHVRMERLASGNAPLLDSHSGWGISSVLGVIERASIAPAEATLRFSKRDDVTPIFGDVVDGILKNVSVGYRVHEVEMIPPADMTSDWTYRAVDWEPFELSLVPIPADAGATVREQDRAVSNTCVFREFTTPAAAAAGPSTTTTRKEPPMTTATNGQTTAPAAEPNAGSTPVNEAQIRAESAQAERERVEGITQRCRAANLSEEFRQSLVNGNQSIDAACRAIIDEIARNAPTTPVATRAEVIEDERTKLRAAMSEAIAHRANPRFVIANNGAGDFRHMSLQRMAEECLLREGVSVRGMSRMELATRAMHTTSDFANVLLDAANKRLRQAYQETVPTYQRWARRAANAPDFKNINVIQLSNAPNLLKVLEDGEFKAGALTDGKETYSVATYGRIIPISRQAIVNDDLNAFDRLPSAMAMAARRFENRTVYDILSGTGTLADTGALFNVTAVTTAGGHANYATGTGSVLSATSLSTARTAMRKQKGYQSEELNITPSFLIVSAENEQLAYQLTSNQYTPATTSAINEFRQGGRTALEPIVEAYLSATTNGDTAWYLGADPNQVDTIEYCYLDGNEGLYLESQIGFEVDGIKLKARLDFAAAPIDFRGLYKGKGA